MHILISGVYPSYILLGGKYMANVVKERKGSIFISQTAIRRWGNSQGIRLSKEIINKTGLKENDQVEISIDDGKIVIEKVTPKYSNLKERLEAFYGKPLDDIFVEDTQEVDVGAPRGKEVW